MPFSGPWITPPPQTVTLTGVAVLPSAWSFERLSGGDTSSFASLADASAPGSGTSALAARWFTVETPIIDPAGIIPTYWQQTFALSQARLLLDFTNATPSHYTPTPPVNVIDVQFDPANPDPFAWITSTLDFTIGTHRDDTFVTTAETTTVELRHYHGDALHPFGPPDALTAVEVDAFTSATALGSLPSLATGPGSMTVHLPAEAVTRPAADPSWGRPVAVLVLNHQGQTLHVAPADPTHDSTSQTIEGAYVVLDAVSVNHLLPVTFTYQPPNYRWVYATTPPLRQYPRDDYLGGAPRQGHVNQSKSTQTSARQGWTNTYR